ncbi:MAG: hypothetical protein ABR555_17865, partial [Pyrinomonadaceae bacterium]
HLLFRPHLLPYLISKMSAKKLVLSALLIILALGLIVVAVAGGIVGYAYYQLGHSASADVARTFLKTNQKLTRQIGQIKDFGTFVTGSINVGNENSGATLKLKVIGERKTINAFVDLVYRRGGQWQVTSAYFLDEQGRRITLLDAYESRSASTRLAV